MKLLLAIASIAFLAASCDKQESAATGANPYPLDVCVVSGEKLGSMGEPVVLIHEGQEIKFCCDSCIPKFKKNPEKYISSLETKATE